MKKELAHQNSKDFKRKRQHTTTAFKNCGLTGYFQLKFTNQHYQVGLTEHRPFAAFCYALSAANLLA
ncbi:MAG TPA: hypothetical protein PKN96_12395, partial [Flavobacterium sp.]|uniref:hypothetical protein n=1 Tax=Flavobacterium sp. TaxID=239 RepID=UPI002CA75BE1